MGMENIFDAEAQWVELPFDQKLKQKKSLMNDTERIRGIKRKRIARKYEKPLRDEFNLALQTHNVKEIKNLLNRTMDGFRVNINAPIEFLLNGEMVDALPIIYVAAIVPNLEIVKILLKYGAEPAFNNYSLIYLMLNDFIEDPFFWRFSFESADELQGYIRFCDEYLSILEYLVQYCNFKRAKDKEGICALWSKILEKVDENKSCFDKKSLDIIYRISLKFI